MIQRCSCCNFEQDSSDPLWQCPRCRHNDVLKSIDSRSQFSRSLGGFEVLKLLGACLLLLKLVWHLFTGEISLRGKTVIHHIIVYQEQPFYYVLTLIVMAVISSMLFYSGIKGIRKAGRSRL